MKEIYPTHSWVPWKFQAVPRGFWASETNRKQYFDWLGSQIGIHSPKDWYQVTSETIRENYGALDGASVVAVADLCGFVHRRWRAFPLLQ
jgi:hypothetical protein